MQDNIKLRAALDQLDIAAEHDATRFATAAHNLADLVREQLADPMPAGRIADCLRTVLDYVPTDEEENRAAVLEAITAAEQRAAAERVAATEFAASRFELYDRLANNAKVMIGELAEYAREQDAAAIGELDRALDLVSTWHERTLQAEQAFDQRKQAAAITLERAQRAFSEFTSVLVTAEQVDGRPVPFENYPESLPALVDLEADLAEVRVQS